MVRVIYNQYDRRKDSRNFVLLNLKTKRTTLFYLLTKSDIFDSVEDLAFARSLIFFLKACTSTLLLLVELVLLRLISSVFTGTVSSSSNRRFRFSSDVSFASIFFEANCWDFRCSSEAKYSPVSSCRSTLRGCWAGGNGVSEPPEWTRPTTVLSPPWTHGQSRRHLSKLPCR